MSSDKRPPSILEQIFANSTARILDHFITFNKFGYSVQELGEILHINETELMETLAMLRDDFNFIKSEKINGVKKYKLKDTAQTHLLRKFSFEVAVFNMDRKLGK